MTRNYITDQREVDAEDVRTDCDNVAAQLGRLRAAFKLCTPDDLGLVADLLDIIDNEKGTGPDQRQIQTWLRCMANTVSCLHAKHGDAFLLEHESRAGLPSWAEKAKAAQDGTQAQEPEQYFIGGDNSGHEYCVPVSKRNEWALWMALPDDDERAWEEPSWAVRIEGNFTFTGPRYKL